jgi:hypothetical protein
VTLKPRTFPGAVPVVALAGTSFMSKKFGKVLAPLFEVVDWIGIPNIELPTLPDDDIPF